MSAPVHSPVYLAELSYPAVRDVLTRDPIALLPVGATEAHGPHLPLATDVFLSEEFARRTQQQLAARGVASVIVPSLAYSVTEFGADFPGTVSIPADVAVSMYVAILRGLQRAGFRRVCVLNSHLEPAHITALRQAIDDVQTRTGARVAFPDHAERRWARTLTDEYKRGNCHAGRYETSLLQAARPDLVDDSLRSALPNNDADLVGAIRAGVGSFAAAGGPLAYFGNPAQATAAEGDDIYARLVHMALSVIDETWPTHPAPS